MRYSGVAGRAAQNAARPAVGIRNGLTHEIPDTPIEPGSPWQHGYCESFNGTFRDQFLNGELFYSLNEARILIEQWRIHYNTVRPHRSIGRRPPAPASWTIDSTTHHALHQSLFPPIPTPQEVSQRLNLH